MPNLVGLDHCAAHSNRERPGLSRRLLTALGGAIKRGVLGKSSHEYMKQFTGGDEYWDKVIAAERGWPQQQSPKPIENVPEVRVSKQAT